MLSVVSLSPLLLWPLPPQHRTSHPECRRRTHTAPWCTQPATWTQTDRHTGMKTHLFQCVLRIYTLMHTLSFSLFVSLPYNHDCGKSMNRVTSLIERETFLTFLFFFFLTNMECFTNLYCMFHSLVSCTFSMDPFWKTCCSSHTTQYSLSVGILCSEYFIICSEKSTVVSPVITPTSITAI